MRLHIKPLNALASLKDAQILENIAFPLKDLKTPLTSQKLASVLALAHSVF
ncbi:hypothetical protein [Helicobacter pylori]|uniref:hypothetical protein n=1 Tax=Helicobacter pylori TaxID=210 RepID=UPI00197A9F91|nr:hypothetical protein [Helicobacter pylori]WQW97296.1 hypothetical protein FE358_03485 [Helicobacter pylori]